MENTKLPLAGLRVVELATVVAAPTASRMLCAYGADVIKVETLAGDEMRRVGKNQRVPHEDYKNPLFTTHNSNKKLISINIKSPEGKEALLKLLDDADIFISNVRAPSLKRAGLAYEDIRDRFPSLIYAHFSGYGPEGPSAADPGFDSTAFWMRSGPMGDWQVPGSFPFIPTYAFGDMSTSSVLLSGILMAVIARQSSGLGTKVETSLFASGIWCNATGVVQTQFERKTLNPDPFRPTGPFDHYYQCADDNWICIFMNEYKRDLLKFARVFGMEDILDDPRYSDIEALTKSGAIVETVIRLNAIFKTKDSFTWRTYLTENNISCEVMRMTKDVIFDEQALKNHYVEEVEYADGLKAVMPCPPVHFSDYSRRPIVPTGKIGENTDEILKDIGYTEAEIADMKKRQVIA